MRTLEMRMRTCARGAAFHGGLWRMAYRMQSIGLEAVAIVYARMFAPHVRPSSRTKTASVGGGAGCTVRAWTHLRNRAELITLKTSF